MKNFGKFGIISSALFVTLALFACSNHNITLKPVTSVSKFPAAIERAQKRHSYMFMQSGINQYTIKSVDLDKAKQQMTVTLNKVDSTQLFGVTNTDNMPSEQKKGELSIQSQIRLFMADSTSYTLDEPHTIPLAKVARIELVN